MSKKEKSELSCRRGAVGGQAIIEGVMMRGKQFTAIAVRRYDNKKITVSRKPNTSISDKIKILKWPVIRGVVNFIESMKLSFSTITEGTDMLGLDAPEAEQSKFDKWVEKHCGKWLISAVSVISVILGVALALGLFIFLPTFIGGSVIDVFFDQFDVNSGSIYVFKDWMLSVFGSLIDKYADLVEGETVTGYIMPEIAVGAIRSVFEGILKVIIFIAYIWLTALIPDMKRVYMYHGAEHKSIFCYEAGLELNVENVKKQSRFHPRCGTSFMFAMMLLSIFIGFFLWWVDVTWLRSLIKLALLPLTVGIGYEFIRFAGRHDNWFVRVLAAPGLWMQRITTKEPEEDIIEVAITSLKCALPNDFPNFYEERLAEQETAESEQSETDAPESEGPEEEKGTEKSEEIINTEEAPLEDQGLQK